ncbi:hypothetical protein IAR50_000939 [Cryptococcus sp. DSM 104548]
MALILTQLVKYVGAHVIGTVSTPEKAELKIVEASGGGVHVSYDSVGKDTREENFEVVRRKGIIDNYASPSGPVPDFPVAKLTPKGLKLTRPMLHAIVDTPEKFKAYTEELVDIVKKCLSRCVLTSLFSAEGINQAEKDMSGRGTTGKLLIHVSD